MDVRMDTKTSGMLIGVRMNGHQFTLIAMPTSNSPIMWLNSISLEERGPASEKLLRDLRKIIRVNSY